MKKFTLLVLSFLLSISFVCAQATKSDTTLRITKPTIVEASCGQCNFKLKTQTDCSLAVRIKGKPYFVTGSNIDDHGDAHAKDGFCNAVRKARVTGMVVNDKFIATSFVLIK